MKVILIGPTGFIGSNILRRCLINSRISLIVVVTRKQLPDELGSPRIFPVVVRDEKDWLEWSRADLLGRMEGASACIWCVGGRQKAFSSAEEFNRANYTYTLSFARALATVPLGSRFRFCYMSCWGSDLTESRFRPLDKSNSYLKGRTEKELFQLTGAMADRRGWELYTFRPGTVTGKDGEININGFKGIIGIVVPTIEISLLAGAVVDVALNGYGEEGISVFFENKEILSTAFDAEEREAEDLRQFNQQQIMLQEVAQNGNGRWE